MTIDRSHPPATEDRGARRRARVHLCVDPPHRRAALAALLASNPVLELVGTADASTRGLRGVVATHPDVVVLQAVGPAIERSRLVARMREASPGCAVVALESVNARPRTLAARGLAADRYLHPDEPLERVYEVVTDVARAHSRGHRRDSATAG